MVPVSCWLDAHFLPPVTERAGQFDSSSSMVSYGAWSVTHKAALTPTPLIDMSPRRMAFFSLSIVHDTADTFTSAGRIRMPMVRASLTYFASFGVPAVVSSRAVWNSNGW